jgi:hypothetical protein
VPKWAKGERTVSGRFIKRVAVLAVLIFGTALAIGEASAQEREVTYRPGDTVKISVVFAGPDADKISEADGYVKTSKPSDLIGQPNFHQDQNSESGKKIGSDTFEIDFPIQANQASGEYQLQEVGAVLTLPQGGKVVFSYRDFPPVTFKVDNPTKLKQPDLKSVMVLPKP